MWIFFVIVYPDRCTICVAALGNSEKVQQRLSFWDDVYGRSNCFYMLNVIITHAIYLSFSEIKVTVDSLVNTVCFFSFRLQNELHEKICLYRTVCRNRKSWRRDFLALYSQGNMEF